MGINKDGQARVELSPATEIIFFVCLLSLWDAQVVLATLSRLMAAKTEEPIFHVGGRFNSQVVIVVVRSYSWIHCGAWFPSPLSNHDTEWYSGSVLGLAQ